MGLIKCFGTGGKPPLTWKDEIVQLFRDGMSSQNIAIHIRGRHEISIAEGATQGRRGLSVEAEKEARFLAIYV
jgi:hypothetical protein